MQQYEDISCSGDCSNINDYNMFNICYLEDRALSETIIESLTKVESDLSEFAFIDYQLSLVENNALQKINVEMPLAIPFYSDLPGNYNNIKDLITFFLMKDQDEENADILTKLIFRNLRSISSSSGFPHLFAELRAYNHKSLHFPDWHVDKSRSEIFIENNTESFEHDQIYLFTLKGKTTLYQHSTKQLRDEFFEIASPSEFSYGYSASLPFSSGGKLDRLFNVTDAISPQIGQITLHLAGYEKGVIHSGPGLGENEQRLVIIAKPLNKEDLYKQ